VKLNATNFSLTLHGVAYNIYKATRKILGQKSWKFLDDLPKPAVSYWNKDGAKDRSLQQCFVA
jgi:hypothetical protein